jgi:hypothetical protein
MGPWRGYANSFEHIVVLAAVGGIAKNVLARRLGNQRQSLAAHQHRHRAWFCEMLLETE